jgi:hypothetical protein
MLKYLEKKGLSEDQVHLLELSLQRAFSADFRDFLLNYGDISDYSFYFKWQAHLGIPNIPNDNDYTAIFSALDSYDLLQYNAKYYGDWFNAELDKLDEKQRLVIEEELDYEGDIFMFSSGTYPNTCFSIQLSKEKDFGSIYYFDYDSTIKVKIADSFTDFLNALQPLLMDEVTYKYEKLTWEKFEELNGFGYPSV